jgi:uncharacterized membrane protein
MTRPRPRILSTTGWAIVAVAALLFTGLGMLLAHALEALTR